MMRLEPGYQEGVDLFNSGDYFQAHEVWEALWRESQGERRLFYHSLIQAAVALYHQKRGHYAGAIRLAQAGRSKIQDHPPVYLGLALEPFWQSVERVLDQNAAEPPMIELLPPAATPKEGDDE